MSEAAKALPAGVIRSSEVKKEAYSRILLLGAPKVGKTTCLLQTLPKALVINCDQEGSTQYAAAEGADFLEIRVGNTNGVGCRKSWTAARRAAKDLSEAGEVRNIVLDTCTVLCDNLVEDISVTMGDDKFALFNELYAQLLGGIKRLAELPAHLWVVGHMDPRKDSVFGILPLLQGKTKAMLGPLLADWVCFEYDPDRKPERAFLLGPQKGWTGNGRNMRRVCVVEPNAVSLLEELGFEP